MDVLERFAETLNLEEPEVLDHLRAFIEWYVGSESEFIPSSGDDVALRTYLMQMKMSGASAKSQGEQVASLRRFYDWAESAGFLPDYHPFTEFSIDRPFLTREQIRRRKEIFSGSSEEREISRLRALNQLAEQLNRSSDVQTTLTAALETLVSLMSLQTAWAFLLPTASSPLVSVSVSSSDRFSLAATCGLPPGLEKNDRHHLKDVKLCHCQFVMLNGNLKRAVNIVECTRLQQAARDNGDNQGLMFHASVPIIASGQPLGIMNVATQDWHPPGHVSFRAQGGAWPPHCVAGTPGARFHPGVDASRVDLIVSKAARPEADAYSGFEGTALAADLRGRGVKRIFVCGLATDYCVRATALDGRREGLEVVVVEDAVRAVDLKEGDGARALEEMRRAGCRMARSGDIAG